MGIFKGLFGPSKWELELREKKRLHDEKVQRERIQVREENSKNYERIKHAFEYEIQEKEENDWRHHPDIPYLNRLKRDLKAFCRKIMAEAERDQMYRENKDRGGIFEDLSEAWKSDTFFSKFEKHIAQRDEYLERIHHIATENYQSEVNFLEGEIRKLRARIDEFEKSFKGAPPEEAAAAQSLMGIANMFGVTDLFKVSNVPQLRVKISEYERDLAEVKTLKSSQTGNTEKQRAQDKLAKVEREIAEIRRMMKKKMAQAEDEFERKKQENRYSQIIDELEEEETKIRKTIARL
jgi:hypothetical protein